MKKWKWTSETARAVCNKTGLPDPIEGAILLAEQFVEENGLPPAAAGFLDVFASTLDARIERVAMAEAGQLVPPLDDDSDFLIWVNEEHSTQRQAFSVCHEMGHLLMPNYSALRGRRRDMEFMRSNPENEEEALCDVVAAQLLMPRRELRARLRGEGVGIAIVDPLCEEFGTSQEATIFNIVRAGVADVAVIYWEWGYRKEQMTRVQTAQTLSMFGDSDDPMLAPTAPPELLLRVRRVYAHGTMADHFFPHNISVDNDSLMAHATELWDKCGDSEGSHVSGPQIIRCQHDGTNVKPEFHTESRAYFTKDAVGAKQTRVISFVFPDEPQNQTGEVALYL